MTSNDSGVESSTDNDDCAQPMPVDKKLVSIDKNTTLVSIDKNTTLVSIDNTTTLVSSADQSCSSNNSFGGSGLSAAMVPVRWSPVRNHEFPLSDNRRVVFARPSLDEMPVGGNRKFKCLFELANPSFPGTLDRFKSCLTPIQEYTEMLLKMEKKDGSTQTRSNVGPCRVHTCRTYARSNTFQARDSHKLCRAASTNNTEMLEELLKNGANPNCWDGRKRTPLHLAASKGYAEAVGLLLSHNANPNLKDALGNNPLHLAACTHHMEVVTLLLKGGTDVSSCDAQGRSPLHLAQSKLRLLTQCKSDVCTSVKQTVLQVIEMLLAYFDKQTNRSDEAELLNAFQTRLQISDTGESVSTGIQDLLNNLSSLRLK